MNQTDAPMDLETLTTLMIEVDGFPLISEIMRNSLPERQNFTSGPSGDMGDSVGRSRKDLGPPLGKYPSFVLKIDQNSMSTQVYANNSSFEVPYNGVNYYPFIRRSPTTPGSVQDNTVDGIEGVPACLNEMDVILFPADGFTPAKVLEKIKARWESIDSETHEFQKAIAKIDLHHMNPREYEDGPVGTRAEYLHIFGLAQDVLKLCKNVQVRDYILNLDVNRTNMDWIEQVHIDPPTQLVALADEWSKFLTRPEVGEQEPTVNHSAIACTASGVIAESLSVAWDDYILGKTLFLRWLYINFEYSNRSILPKNPQTLMDFLKEDEERYNREQLKRKSDDNHYGGRANGRRMHDVSDED